MKFLASHRRSLFCRNTDSLVTLVLIFSLSIALIRWGRPVQAQSECKVECTATAPASAQVATSVSFASTATAGGCASSPTYEWDFGDGTQTSLQQNITHTYAAPGTYTWKLTASAAVATTTIDTIAGGYGEHAPARQAPFTTAIAVARDPRNRGVYLIDETDNGSLIRFLNTGATTVTVAGKTIEAGKVRRLAGDGGGAISQDDWDIPISTVAFAARGLAVNSNGNLLYFSDAANNRVWAYNVSGALQAVGARTLAPGNVGALATIGNGDVGNLAVHPTTGEVFVVQGVTAGNRVSRIAPNGTLTTVAGNGAATKINDPFPQPPVNATDLPLLTPGDILFDAAGNLYIADTGHARVVRVEAGGLAFQAYQFTFGQGESTPFPAGLAAAGNKVYVAAGNQQTIVEVASGAIVAGTANTACDYTSSSCGDGGSRSAASFYMQGSTSTPPIVGLESDASGLYVLDQGTVQKGRVRYVNLSGAPVQLAGATIAPNSVDTIAGSGLSKPYDTGLAVSATLGAPTGVAVDANGNLFIADTLANRLRFVNRGSNMVTLFAGTPARQIVEPGAIVTINKNVGVNATDNTPANQAGFDIPQGLTVTNQGVFVADSKGGPAVDLRRTGSIRFVNTSGASVTFFPSAATPIVVPPGNVATIAGGGSSTTGIGNGGFARGARFLAPSDVAVNQMSGDVYVADAGNKAVRRISGSHGVVSSLNLPVAQYTGLAFDPASRLHVVNHDSGQVWRETAAGTGVFNPINTIPINKIRDVAIDAAGAVYVMTASEESNPPQNRIVRITSAGATEAVAGTTTGFDGDGGPALAAKLSFTPDPINVATLGPPVIVPQTVNIAVSASGEIVFADTRNNRIRRIGPGTVSCVKTGTITITGDNPVPTLSQLTPGAAVVGAREFSLTVTGSGFVTGSKLRWNGVERQTNYISSTQLTAIIPSTDLGMAGTAFITVFNPPPQGGVSASLSLPIRQPNPVPALASISPSRAAVGTAFTLRVAGSGFVPGSVVQWKG
ncbi:MAG: PKD domain-containing protein, partial [Blastocatellia bacterium]